MRKKYTKNLTKLTYFGIDENIPAGETVEVNLRDLLKVHATLQELNRFFHQPLHYDSLEDVEEYLGTYRSNRALRLINVARGQLMRHMFPKKLEQMFDEGVFAPPERPYYFRARRKRKA